MGTVAYGNVAVTRASFLGEPYDLVQELGSTPSSVAHGGDCRSTEELGESFSIYGDAALLDLIPHIEVDDDIDPGLDDLGREVEVPPEIPPVKDTTPMMPTDETEKPAFRTFSSWLSGLAGRKNKKRREEDINEESNSG